MTLDAFRHAPVRFAMGAAIALALPNAASAQSAEGLVERHQRVCVNTAAQPAAVAGLLDGDEGWRPMFADGGGLVSRISAADPMDVVMARIVNTRGVIEAICSVQRRGGDFETLKADFEAATKLKAAPRYSSRTVAVYVAREADGRLESVEQPDLNRARRDPSYRIYSLSKMGDDALIVVSAPQGG